MSIPQNKIDSKIFIAILQKVSLAFFFVLFLSACGDDSGSEPSLLDAEKNPQLNNEVEIVKDLGRCTEDRDGDTIYVVEKLRDYICKNHAWIDASAENDLNKSSSSKKNDGNEKTSSSEKGKSSASSSSSSEKAMLSTSSSSSSEKAKSSISSSSSSEKTKSSASSSSSSEKGTEVKSSSSSFNKDAYSDENRVVKDRSILGVAQKGPFKFGSPVFLRELSENGLNYTGMEYRDEINSNKGDFVIPNVNLISPYASIEVRGLFRNEITGEYTKDSISLFALTDLTTKSKVNVNLLTHLEYSRAMYLVRKGYSVSAAKKQANQEIMTAFEQPTTVTSSEDLSVFEDAHDNNVNYANASLMMMSLLFLSGRSDVEFNNALEKFIKDFEKDGFWDDEKTKAAMADFATEIDVAKVHANVKSWNVLDIPKFEAPLETFWNNVYGLGGCTESRSGVVLKNKNTKSKNAGVYYKCNASRSNIYPYDDTGHWVAATTNQKDTYQWTAGNDNELKKGNVTDTIYVYNGTQWVVSERETAIGLCVSNNENVVSKYEDVYYTCHDKAWKKATVLEYDTYGQECATNGSIVYGNVVPTNQYVCDAGSFRMIVMTDLRDNQSYKVTTIGEQTWMAENLCYQARNYDFSGFGEQPYCFYEWEKAMNGDEGCDYNKDKTCTPPRGICPEGWHIPTMHEFDILDKTTGKSLDALCDTVYNSRTSCTNVYGFSAKSVGCLYDGHRQKHITDFIFTTSSYDTIYRYFRELRSNCSGDCYIHINGTDYAAPIRCLQD